MAPIGNRKRAAAVLDGGQTTKGSATCCDSKKRRIGSYYEEVSCLGKGGFGAVVKARHLVTGKSVAVKFLHSKDGINVDELLREARFLEACGGNPYVVGFEGLERDPATGELFLAMEYVGRSLEAVLRERKPLPEATVRSFMFQLLTGAKEMQERQIIHRDIKPANVLIAEDGELVKICDLGLAMSMSEPTPYAQAGTRFYMAPEMLLGKPDYDALVDSWSLGCVMAELVNGKTLFKQPHETSEIWQLCTIFRVVSTPNDTTWPGFASLPLAAKARQGLETKRSKLPRMFPPKKLSKDGFEVLEGLLTCNPNNRLTAAAALQLPWFAPLRATVAAKVDPLGGSPRKEVAEALPPEKIIPPEPETPKKKKKLPAKIVPPATLKKNELRIPLAI